MVGVRTLSSNIEELKKDIKGTLIMNNKEFLDEVNVLPCDVKKADVIENEEE